MKGAYWWLSWHLVNAYTPIHRNTGTTDISLGLGHKEGERRRERFGRRRKGRERD